mmetsp:Transcript_41640/g.107752  ORF Transcript_41640/g.107752 Transcript_41640/m.107752 type:complete len:209 (+) Transcript_41640:939-1565(+)
MAWWPDALQEAAFAAQRPPSAPCRRTHLKAPSDTFSVAMPLSTLFPSTSLMKACPPLGAIKGQETTGPGPGTSRPPTARSRRTSTDCTSSSKAPRRSAARAHKAWEHMSSEKGRMQGLALAQQMGQGLDGPLRAKMAHRSSFGGRMRTPSPYYMYADSTSAARGGAPRVSKTLELLPVVRHGSLGSEGEADSTAGPHRLPIRRQTLHV